MRATFWRWVGCADLALLGVVAWLLRNSFNDRIGVAGVGSVELPTPFMILVAWLVIAVPTNVGAVLVRRWPPMNTDRRR